MSHHREIIGKFGSHPARKSWMVPAFALVAAVMLVAAVHLAPFLRDVLASVDRLGAWGPVLFIGVYVLATVFFVPGSVLTLGAGALFGVVWGSLYVLLGATLGATAAFLVSRYLARDWVEQKTKGNKIFAAIDNSVAEQGWKIVGLMRLSPVFPFTLLNYAFGITRVTLREYILASWIGILPGTVMYVYFGSLARSVGNQQRTPAEWALYTVGLAATIAVTIMITRAARRALKQRTEAE